MKISGDCRFGSIHCRVARFPMRSKDLHGWVDNFEMKTGVVISPEFFATRMTSNIISEDTTVVTSVPELRNGLIVATRKLDYRPRILSGYPRARDPPSNGLRGSPSGGPRLVAWLRSLRCRILRKPYCKSGTLCSAFSTFLIKNSNL
jgi:hypothetical protein